MLAVSGLGYEVPAVLRDLSESGCYFDTGATVNLGWTVSLSFLVKPRDLCQGEGLVVRTHNTRGFGVRFEKVNGPMLDLVRRLLSTPFEQQGPMLQALCDPHIEIGYIRRPGVDDPPPSVDLGPPPPECPKCGCRIPAEGPTGGASSSCLRCGLIFARWTPEQASEMPRLDARGEQLWADVVDRWEEPETHDAFLKHCSLLTLLPVAGRFYRQRLDLFPGDVMATRMQERLMAMATAAFIRPSPVHARAVTRNWWFWALLALFGLGGIAAATLKMAPQRPPAPPLAAPVVRGVAP
jgi:hypothetical protein